MANKNGHDICWRCGVLFPNKDSWKKWPQGPTCLTCRTQLEEAKQEHYLAKYGKDGEINYAGLVGKKSASDFTDYTKLKKPLPNYSQQYATEGMQSLQKMLTKTLYDASIAGVAATQSKPKAKAKAMQKGEIKKLSKDSTPFQSEQWAVQGTGKIPYVVTHKPKESNQELVWQCSCPAWKTTYPREDCKHILKIKLTENVPVEKKVEKVTVVDAGAALSQAKGRKFR